MCRKKVDIPWSIYRDFTVITHVTINLFFIMEFFFLAEIWARLTENVITFFKFSNDWWLLGLLTLYSFNSSITYHTFIFQQVAAIAVTKRHLPMVKPNTTLRKPSYQSLLPRPLLNGLAYSPIWRLVTNASHLSR